LSLHEYDTVHGPRLASRIPFNPRVSLAMAADVAETTLVPRVSDVIRIHEMQVWLVTSTS